MLPLEGGGDGVSFGEGGVALGEEGAGGCGVVWELGFGDGPGALEG